MLAFALSSGVEVETARGFIAEFNIAPESPDILEWPWPIRVRTLGGFEVMLDGVPLRSSGKSQKKPLELLKALAAQAGSDINTLALAEILWPDAEGDAALSTLEVTLRRLRKLLRRDDAIVLRERRLSLNLRTCWTDTVAFERAHEIAETKLGLSDKHLMDSELDQLGQRLLSLYPGHFLAGEDDRPWMLPCRERLASRIFRDLSAIGQRWEDRGAVDKAELIYRRGIELDAVSEVLYRRLMLVQTQRGDRAGALATYARCRRMLSITLGVAPSAETENARLAAFGRC